MSPEHKQLKILVVPAGDFFAIQTQQGLTFYQAGADGEAAPVGHASPPPSLKPLLTDNEGEVVTRDTKIEALGLTVRVFNVLKREGFDTVGQIIEKSAETPGYWYQLRNIGGKGADELAARVYEWSRAGL